MEKTIGNVTYQFRQGILEARDNARKYIDHLKTKFKDEIDTIEGKRTETANIVKEIEKIRGKVATLGKEAHDIKARVEEERNHARGSRTVQTVLVPIGTHQGNNGAHGQTAQCT